METSRIAERVARDFVAGEDWVLTDGINRLLPQVVQEIRRRGGSSTLTGGRIIARKFVLDMLHAIPLEIRLYEGTYYPGKVLVEATFSGGHPVPVRDRQPFNAKAVVDSIADAFMSLVNYREARADDIGLRSDSADAVILPGLNEEMDLLENQSHKMWTADRVYFRDSASVIAAKRGRVQVNRQMVASELLKMARELLGMDFPTQDAMDKYLKDHPDADKGNHKVVRHDPENMDTHPFNLMRKRKNEEMLKEIGKHHKKDPKDLTVDDIEKFNQRKKR